MRLGNTIAAALVWLLTLAPAAASAEAVPHLALHIVDCVGLSSTVANGVQHAVIRILSTAGIHVTWSSGAPDTVLPPSDVIVVILSREMAMRKAAADRVADGVLGTASSAGRRAWVFFDRIEEVAWAGNEPLAPVLAGVIAHEAAHAVAGIVHSTGGVMSSTLGSTAQIYRGFSRDESERLRAALDGRERPVTLTARASKR
jgi:hypothetical protein